MSHRLTRLCALLACLSLLASSACDKPPPPPVKKSKPAIRPTRPVTPELVRAGMTINYRLRPDRRLLGAIAELSRILSGKRTFPTVDALPGGTGFVVRSEKIEVGRLPEFPDFSDHMRLLSDWAKKLAKEHPVALDLKKGGKSAGTEDDGSEGLFLAESPATALRQIQKRWQEGEHTTVLLHQATRALCAASFLMVDLTEVGDLVPQEALAMLALDKAVAGADTSREEALCAKALGHGAAAEKAAAELDKGDPLRLYLLHEDKGLRKLAGGKKGTLGARYLMLLRMEMLHDMQQEDWRDRYFADGTATLPLLRTRLDLPRSSAALKAKLSLPAEVLSAIQKEVPGAPEPATAEAQKPADQGVLARFLDLVKAETAPAEGKKAPALLAPGLFSEYHRAYLFSALYIVGASYAEALPPAEAQKGFAGYLAGPPSPSAQEFKRWHDVLLQIHSSKPGDKSYDLITTMKTSLGVQPLFRIYKELRRRSDTVDGPALRAVKRLVQSMDTRVTHRELLSGLARDGLLDLHLAERLLRSVATCAPADHPNLRAFLAEFTADHEGLRALLHGGELDLASQVQAIESLSAAKELNEAGVVKEYRLLMKDAQKAKRDDSDVRGALVDHLEKTRDYKTARKVIEEWLAKNKKATGVVADQARTRLARIAYLDERYKDGWKVIQPALEDHFPAAMQRGALLLSAMGQNDEALALAKERLKRFPGTDSQALLVEVLWRHGDIEGATRLLAEPPVKYTPADWSGQVGRRFAEVFGDRAKDGLGAFEAMRKAKVDTGALVQVAAACSHAEKKELAVGVLAQLQADVTPQPKPGDPPPRLQQSGAPTPDIALRSYRALKEWKGEEQATDWLKDHIQPAQMASLSTLAFAEQKDSLLWSVVRDPQKTDTTADLVWLLRAASVVRSGDKKSPHLEALMQHYQAEQKGLRHQLGRYLIGLLPEKAVLALGTDAGKTAQVAFYVAVRHQGEGDYEMASDDYRVAEEIAIPQVPEYHWAVAQLRRWHAENRSLSRLAAAQK